jgi:hypothetical protein
MWTLRDSDLRTPRLILWLGTAASLVVAILYRWANYNECNGEPDGLFWLPQLIAPAAVFLTAWPRTPWYWALVLGLGAFVGMYVFYVVTALGFGTACFN